MSEANEMRIEIHPILNKNEAEREIKRKGVLSFLNMMGVIRNFEFYSLRS